MSLSQLTDLRKLFPSELSGDTSFSLAHSTCSRRYLNIFFYISQGTISELVLPLFPDLTGHTLSVNKFPFEICLKYLNLRQVVNITML